MCVCAWVCAMVAALVVGSAGAADITIRSVPYEDQPKPAQQPVKRSAVKTEPVQPAMIGAACPCGHSIACVGPKGGRYCINSRGQKKYQ